MGIESEKRGAARGADSLFRAFTDEERAALTEKLRIWYRQFLSRVSEGRKMAIEQVDALARGRVYSGDAALAVGLIDQLRRLWLGARARARARRTRRRRARRDATATPIESARLCPRRP